MVKQLGPNCAVVTISELGSNCWHPRRLVKDSSRCDRIWTCNYPEKSSCVAIHAEISHLKDEQKRLMKISSNLDIRIEELTAMLQK